MDTVVPVLIAVAACLSGAEDIAQRSAAKSPETLRTWISLRNVSGRFLGHAALTSPAFFASRSFALAVECCTDFLLCSFMLTAITPVMATCPVDSVLT